MNFDLIGGGALLTLIFGSYGFTWAIRREGRDGRKKLHERVDEVGEKISACQVNHAELYATNADVDRLDKNIAEMRKEVNGKLDRLTDHLISMR